MRIAEVAPLVVAVPPKDYGGTERVIANLTDALVRLGHDVTLFASGDSRTLAHQVAYVPCALRPEQHTDVLAYHLALLTEVYRRAADFDIIHSHLGYMTLPFTQGNPTPTVLTLHGRLDIPGEIEIRSLYHDANYVSISNNQRHSQPDLNYITTIYHGVDVPAFPFRNDPGDYLAFVGRISPEKGPEHAIAIAKRTGIPLKIAAKIDPVDRYYFEREIEPLLDDPMIEFLGPLPEQPKRELMAGALALLSPIMWPEPFGMVFIEAMACGTPVLTRPRGSATEVISDGVSGFLRESDDDLAVAVRDVTSLARQTVRNYALKWFDMRRMALEYVNVFRTLTGEEASFSPEATFAFGG